MALEEPLNPVQQHVHLEDNIHDVLERLEHEEHVAGRIVNTGDDADARLHMPMDQLEDVETGESVQPVRNEKAERIKSSTVGR